MKLLIDIGNTRLKLATLENETIRFVAAFRTESTNELKRNLENELGKLQAPVQECIAVSVGHAPVNQTVQAACKPAALRWVSPSAHAAGVTNRYPDPSQLGADRWVGMIGLTRHFAKPHPPVVLASFGTATTVDTLSPDNVFMGGLILPGVSMMHEALANGTANLPNAAGALENFPTGTISAISSGVIAAQVGAVVRQIKIARSHFGQEPLVCASGGAWTSVATELHRTLDATTIRELPHIVLDGLAMLASDGNS